MDRAAGRDAPRQAAARVPLRRAGWPRRRAAIASAPCAPPGRHRYVHELLALDRALPALAAPTRAELLRAAEGHVLGRAVLVGTYEKRR